VPAAWNFRKSYKKISDLLDRVYGDVNPIMRHASAIADNVNYVTTSVRTDVQQINATIATANQRLQEAMALTEERLREFNALLEVVQQEAETMFVATASTVRGVRTGAAALHTEDDEDAAMGAAALASEELDDGYGDPDATEAGTTRPRVRPRRRGWT
jgi:ABC-type transporter Mla subunit MlaD